MKTKFILLMMAIFMIVACGENSGTNTDSKQKEVAKEAEGGAKSGKGLSKMPTDENLYTGMLKIFCSKHYQLRFDKRFVSLALEDLVLQDDSTVLVSGPLVFYEEEVGDKTGETEFRATITRTGQDKYRITFENKGEECWEDTTLTINYFLVNPKRNP